MSGGVEASGVGAATVPELPAALNCSGPSGPFHSAQDASSRSCEDGTAIVIVRLVVAVTWPAQICALLAPEVWLWHMVHCWTPPPDTVADGPGGIERHTTTRLPGAVRCGSVMVSDEAPFAAFCVCCTKRGVCDGSASVAANRVSGVRRMRRIDAMARADMRPTPTPASFRFVAT